MHKQHFLITTRQSLSTKSSMLLIIMAGYYRIAHYDLYLYLYSCTFSNLSSFSSLKSFSKYSFWSFFLCFSSLRKQTLFLIMLTTASNTQAPYLPKHYIMALTMYTYLPTVKNFILCLFNCFKSESLLKLMSLLNCLLESRYHSRLWRINRMVWDLQVEEDF